MIGFVTWTPFFIYLNVIKVHGQVTKPIILVKIAINYCSYVIQQVEDKVTSWPQLISIGV